VKPKEEASSQSKRRRRYYDEEFKRSAVELLEKGERSAVQLARELGVSDCSLSKWKR
jgi:transposase-like protein